MYKYKRISKTQHGVKKQIEEVHVQCNAMYIKFRNIQYCTALLKNSYTRIMSMNMLSNNSAYWLFVNKKLT